MLRLTPYKGPTAFHVLMLFAWAHARLLDSAFDPPRQWLSEDFQESPRQKRVHRRFGNGRQGIEIVDVDALDAKGMFLGTAETAYLAYGLPDGCELTLRYLHPGVEPAALELEVQGPPMQIHTIMAAFKRRFGEEGTLTPAELEEARRRMRQSLDSGSRGTAWLYGELILEAEPFDREAQSVVEMAHRPPC